MLHTRVVTGNGGGPEKTLLNSPRFLRRNGVDSACLFMRPPGDEGFRALEAKAAAAKAEIIGVDDRGPFDVNVVRECIRICRRRNVDVWHGHDYKSNALGLLVSRFHPMHLITTAHGWVRFTWRTPVYYCVDRFSMKRYDQVICVSQDLYDRCHNSGIVEDRLSLIDNAIVVDDYDPSPPRADERASFQCAADDIVLAAAGRLSEEKGFHHLIDAVARLHAEESPVKLLIAGEGHLREQLQQQIKQRHLQNHVKLVGFLQDPRTLYRAADVFVLSSLREGLPNVVLEAMATKRAVVTTKVNGIPRLVQNGHNGIVVNTDDVDSLHSGIRQMLSSPEQRRHYAAQGLRTVQEQFCFETRIKKIVDVYRRLDASLAKRIDQHMPQSKPELELVAP